MSTSVNIFRSSGSSSSSGGGGGGKEEQTKSVTITENGTTTITPDEGKTLSRVTVNTEVEGGGQTIVSAVGKAVYEYDYMMDNGQWQWHQIQPVDIDGGIKYFSLENNQEHGIAVTVDGNAPQEDNTNVLLSLDTNIGDILHGLIFRIEIEGEVFWAVIDTTTPTE